MLFDPRWTRTSKPTFSEPSLKGFELFVAFKMLRDPDGEYDWSDAYECGVGQYLMSIGRWSPHWSRYAEGELLWALDALALGNGMRDERGRFTADHKRAVWRWRDLHKRLQRWRTTDGVRWMRAGEGTNVRSRAAV